MPVFSDSIKQYCIYNLTGNDIAIFPCAYSSSINYVLFTSMSVYVSANFLLNCLLFYCYLLQNIYYIRVLQRNRTNSSIFMCFYIHKIRCIHIYYLKFFKGCKCWIAHYYSGQTTQSIQVTSIYYLFSPLTFSLCQLTLLHSLCPTPTLVIG